MGKWGIVVIGLLFILIVTFSRIRFHLRWTRINGDDELSFTIYALFGFVKWNKSVKKIDYINIRFGIKTDHQTIDIATLLNWFNEMKILLAHLKGPSKWMRDTLHHINVEHIRWRTVIGLNHAAATATCVGGVYAIKHGMNGIAANKFNFKKPAQIIVIPNYNQATFSTQFSSMFSIRVGHAIYAVVLLVLRIIKTKGGLKTWRNILFRA